VLWEPAAGLLKSAPSGDVDPMPPDKGTPVCATLWLTPSPVMASITAAAKRNLMVFPLLREGMAGLGRHAGRP
jgi:hypothetical protein